MKHEISAEWLTIDKVGEILREHAELSLSADARNRIETCRNYLDNKMETQKEPIYGITTGFGSLCNISIDATQLRQLQKNLVMSHSCGVGERVPDEIVRLMLLLKAQSLSYGNSGVQLVTVQRLLDFFNNDILPVVYQQGSLGASGDLAPLANMSLPLLGLGMVSHKGELRPAADVLAEMGWEPIELQSKEGLALLNGTQFMSAYGVWSLLNAKRLSKLADKIAAMNAAATQTALEAVTEAGSTYDEITSIPQEVMDAAKEMGGTLEEMYTVTFDGQPAGYAVKLTASGSQGLIEMVIGVDAEQKITGISVVNHSETSGIGTKVCGNKPNDDGVPVLDQFVGMSGAGTLKVGKTVTAISGATVSTKGVTKGANAALAAVAALG